MATNIIGSGAETAQLYLSEAAYPVGTLVKPSGNNPYEVTLCVTPYCTQPIGVVSTNPGILSNADADLTVRQGGAYIPVTTHGRTIALVQGPAFAGDKLVAGNIPGTLMSLEQNPPTTVSGMGIAPTVLAICLDTNQTKSPQPLKVVVKGGTPNPTGNLIVNNITNIGTSTVGSLVTTNGVNWANGIPYSPGTITTTQFFNGSTTQLSSMFTNIGEVATVSNASVSGTIPFYVTSQSVLYYQGTATSNFTINVLGSNVNVYSSTPTVQAQGTVNAYTMTINEVGTGSFTSGMKVGSAGYTINGATYPPLFANTVIQTGSGTTGTYTLNNWGYLPAQSAIYGYAVTSTTGTSLSTLLQPGQSLSITFLNTNGGTPYYLTGFQIDGIAQSVRWQNGASPSYGSANSIDVYSFTIIRTYATQIVTPPTCIPVYTVLGSITKFA